MINVLQLKKIRIELKLMLFQRGTLEDIQKMVHMCSEQNFGQTKELE